MMIPTRLVFLTMSLFALIAIPAKPTAKGAPTDAEVRACFTRANVDYWASLDYKQITVSYQKILMASPVRYNFVGAGWQVCYAVKLDYVVNRAMLPPNSTHYYSTRYTNDLYRLYRNEFGELTMGDHVPGQMTDLK